MRNVENEICGYFLNKQLCVLTFFCISNYLTRINPNFSKIQFFMNKTKSIYPTKKIPVWNV